MRWMLALMAVALMAGCFGGRDLEAGGVAAIADCRSAPATDHTLFFGPGMQLGHEPSAAGYSKGNAFSSGFVTNDLKEWLSAEPLEQGLWLVGNVTLEFWTRSTGTPAPLEMARDPANPDTFSEGYHFFNQFGTDRTFQPAYATEFGPAFPTEGQVDHYTEVLAMPQGGFVAESGDRFRVLLTDLAIDNGQNGGGHDVLYGGETPSQVRFTAKCWKDVAWAEVQGLGEPVSLPANQGLFTGYVTGYLPVDPTSEIPQDHARQEFEIPFPEGAERLTVTLTQTNDATPMIKDDIDIILLDTAGNAAWSIGSPYSDESGTLWLDNLQAVFPANYMTVQVNSYSGIAYTGVLKVTFESARA